MNILIIISIKIDKSSDMLAENNRRKAVNPISLYYLFKMREVLEFFSYRYEIPPCTNEIIYGKTLVASTQHTHGIISKPFRAFGFSMKRQISIAISFHWCLHPLELLTCKRQT